MSRKLFYIVLMLLLPACLQAQKYAYQNVFTGGNEYQIYKNRELSLGPDDSKYIVSDFQNTYQLQGWTVSAPKYGLVMMKFNAQDSLLWVKKILDSDSSEFYYYISAEKDNHVYISINYFNPLQISNTAALGDSVGCVLLKIDSAGEVKKSIHFGTPTLYMSTVAQHGIADTNGNLTLLCGIASKINLTSWLDTLEGFPISLNHNDMFLVKYDTAFIIKSIKKIIGGNGQQSVNRYYINEGNIFMEGSNTSGSISIYFDTLALTYPGVIPDDNKFFVACIDTNGNAKWARYFYKYNNTFQVSPTILKGIVSKGNRVYFVGHCFDNGGNILRFQSSFNGQTSIYGVSSFQYFVTAYDTLGQYQWAKFASSNSNNYINSLVIDSIDLLYFTGKSSSIYFDSTTVTSYGGDDAFIACMDSTGAYKWGTHAGGGNIDIGNGIGIDKQGVIYTMGGTMSNPCYQGQDTIYSVTGPTLFLSKMVLDTTTSSSTSIQDNYALSDFELYPNPTNGKFTIKLSNTAATTLSVCDMTGKLVYTQQLSANQQNHQISLPYLSSGLYLVQLDNGVHRITRKLSIE